MMCSFVWHIVKYGDCAFGPSFVCVHLRHFNHVNISILEQIYWYFVNLYSFISPVDFILTWQWVISITFVSTYCTLSICCWFTFRSHRNRFISNIFCFKFTMDTSKNALMTIYYFHIAIVLWIYRPSVMSVISEFSLIWTTDYCICFQFWNFTHVTYLWYRRKDVRNLVIIPAR